MKVFTLHRDHFNDVIGHFHLSVSVSVSVKVPQDDNDAVVLAPPEHGLRPIHTCPDKATHFAIACM